MPRTGLYSYDNFLSVFFITNLLSFLLIQKLEDVDIQLNESHIRCNYLAEDNEKLSAQLRLQREELEAERLTNAQVEITNFICNENISNLFQLAEQLTSESSRQMFGRTLSRTESIIKSSEIRIQDLDAQVRALKFVCDGKISTKERRTISFQENEKLKHENEELRERAVVSYVTRKEKYIYLNPFVFHIVVYMKVDD